MESEEKATKEKNFKSGYIFILMKNIFIILSFNSKSLKKGRGKRFWSNKIYTQSGPEQQPTIIQYVQNGKLIIDSLYMQFMFDFNLYLWKVQTKK